MTAGLPQKAREEGKLSLRDMQVVMPRKIKIQYYTSHAQGLTN
jgi:hypothetical protein